MELSGYMFVYLTPVRIPFTEISTRNAGPVANRTLRIPKNDFYLFSFKRPAIFVFPQVKPKGKLILAVGEGTTIDRNLMI